ncbi:MAG: hypothetical protein K6E33_00695 [Lachnospiraceae bacterium]|nr:hypothetical protein [Lachnospiraceae bacterium]
MKLLEMRNIRLIASALIIILMMPLLSGCMKDESLEKYKEEMEQFFIQAAAYNDSINAIDPQAEDASQQFLTEIDGLRELINEMAGYEVPGQFSSCESLADEAAENMNTAAEYWHQAYGEDGSFDEQMSDTAKQYYERANKRINAILEILHGNVPEDATVIEQEAVIGTAALQDETETATDQDDDQAEGSTAAAPGSQDPVSSDGEAGVTDGAPDSAGGNAPAAAESGAVPPAEVTE